MSLIPDKDVKIYKKTDPVIKLDDVPAFVVNRGGLDLTYTPFTSTSFTTSNLQITVNPPSGNTVVNRLAYLRCPFRLTFTSSAGAPSILDIGANDAPRSFALSKVISNIKLVLDNGSTSIQNDDIIMAYERYIKSDTKRRDLGMIPYEADNYQDYSDYLSQGSAKNNLGSYGESGFGAEEHNGGYFNLNVVSDDGSTAVLDIELIEPLWLSPMLWKQEYNSKGLALLNQMQLYVQFGDLRRIWAHSSAGIAIDSINVSLNSAFDNPALLVNFVQMQPDQHIPLMNLYNYYDVNVYKTENKGITNAGASDEIKSQNIQVGQTPKRMYLYIMRREVDRTFETTDTFAKIDNISIQWNTRNGILADADTYQLYNISSKNGFQPSYNGWSKFCGSVFCADFGSDIPLQPLDAPGRIGQGQLSVRVNFTNISQENITYELDIILINDGVCIKTLNNTQFLTGVATPSDALLSPQVSELESDILAIQDPYGGDLLGGAKFSEKIKKGAKKAVRGAKKVSKGLKAIEPIAETIAPRSEGVFDALDLLGLGYTKKEIEQMYGGKMASRRAMKKRMRKY